VKEIAEVNAFTEDDVKKVYNYGQAIGLTGDQLTKFVKTAFDFSARSGREIGFAMRKVATEAQKGADEFERFSKGVRGAGKDLADSDFGFKRLGVNIKEFQEAVGISSMFIFQDYCN